MSPEPRRALNTPGLPLEGPLDRPLERPLERPLDLPAPVRPEYLLAPRATAVDELLPLARVRTDKRYGFPALGPVGAGQRILVITPPDQDPLVLAAMRQAMLAAGAAAVAHVTYADLGLPDERFSAADGWREIPDRLEPLIAGSFTPEAGAARRYLDGRGDDFDVIYAAKSGLPHWQKHVRPQVKGLWVYSDYEALISRFNSFPDALWELIDRKLAAAFGRADRVRITDPQGTDIGWDVTAEEAAVWSAHALLPGHILGSTIHGVRLAYGLDRFAPVARRHFAAVHGVICGTANHTGFYPAIRVEVEGGMIRSIEGGGRYGELWQEMVARFADLEYPGYPRRGWAYLNDCTIGTNPKGHRQLERLWSSGERMTNLLERFRAGIVHFGFGAEHWDPAFMAYARAHGAPTHHVPQVHNYFATYAIRDRHSGEWVDLVRNGWLTLLDDPDVVRLAGIFGDPAAVLGYDWIPAIPGLNVPGDYQRDFAADPVAWIRRETAG